MTEDLIATGKLKVHAKGFGFLLPDNRATFPEDIFIPRHATGSAVDGDRVEVAVDPFPSEKGPEGHVLHILRRGRSHVAGTVTELLPDKTALVYVPLIGIKEPLHLIHCDDASLKPGDRIVIKVVSWNNKQSGPVGELASKLGHIADPSCDVQAAIEEYELEDYFSKEVQKEVERFGAEVTADDLKNREDLRHHTCVTIDPDTAKDFDDAISLTQDEKGQFHLGIHIADVSHYVRPGTALDQEAKERCNSVYFPGTVVPMLPHALSSHLCSLKPDVDRLAASILITLDSDGNVLNSRTTKSVIQSRKRFSYEEAKQVLDGEKKSPHLFLLKQMVSLCHLLKKQRAKRGSIEFAMPDIRLNIDKKGVPKEVSIVSYDITHQMIEEFMLKANEIVATALSNEGKPLTYRVHEEPAEENLKNFAILANAFGHQLSDIPTPEELQAFFDEVRSLPYGQFFATQFIRSQKLAAYSIQNIGHFGLALEHYCHFTSPIRRYIDLVVHRVLFNQLDYKEDLEEIAAQCSEKERLSARAENSVILLKKLRLLLENQKKERYRHYTATVTSIKPFGFAFEVEEFLLEGFIHVSDLDNDYYSVNYTNTELRGKRTRTRFKSGDKIEVFLKHVNLIIQDAKWMLVPLPKKKRRGKW